MTISRLGHGGLDLCSVQYWHGFNSTRPEKDAIAQQIGAIMRKMVDRNVSRYENADRERSTGGVEMLLGCEGRSDRDNTVSAPPNHHHKDSHCGHLVKEVVEECELGEVWLSPWTRGEGSSGSQMRVVMWSLRGRRQLTELVNAAREALEAGRMDKKGTWSYVLKGFVNGEAW